MKTNASRSILGHPTTQQQQIWSALFLAGLLSLCSSLTSIESAIASPQISSQSTSDSINVKTESVVKQSNNLRTNRLPAQVATAVRQDAAKRTGIAPGKFKITEYSRETWPNGCLGIAEPDQICTQALVPGWRVVISDGSRTWVYRTNSNGRTVSLENESVSSNTPKSDRLDGGETIAANIIRPVPIPASELPPALDRGVVFRAVSSGGITGRTYETTLLNDGTLIRVRIGDANDSERSVRRISPSQLRGFQQLLKRQSLSRFNGLSYPAPSGAADFITVTITSSSGTTRYADLVQNNLPQPLRQVVQAWNQLTAVG